MTRLDQAANGVAAKSLGLPGAKAFRPIPSLGIYAIVHGLLAKKFSFRSGLEDWQAARGVFSSIRG